MESGNSGGSMQSSSGGDEEYDSRSESISAFFNSHIAHAPPHLPPSFDPSLPPNNMFLVDTLPTRPNPVLGHLDNLWTRPDHNVRSDLDRFLPTPAPTTHTQTNPFVSGQSGEQSMAPLEPNNGNSNGLNIGNGNGVTRNPKKRSRASRRAPTTVLTTDTTNFRAMVQEFTGIPAPPFTASAFPRTTRLDLFRSSSGHLDHFLLRPSPTKGPFISPAATTATSITNHNNTSSGTTNPVNFQLSSDLGFSKQQQPQNLLVGMNMKDPILNFQSHIDASPKYNPLPNSAILGAKSHQGPLDLPQTDHALKMGLLEDQFGLSHSHGHGHGHVGSQLAGIPSIDSTTLSRQRAGADQGVVRTINSERVAPNGKLSSASSSNFHGDKLGSSGNVTARSGEGMIESWICSSD